MYNRTQKQNAQPIALRTSYGSLVNGYQPSIIRPFDSVSVSEPRDLKRSSFYDSSDECNWPCYAGSNFQSWCSEEDAMKYHAMRPIIEPDAYNNLLSKMFDKLVQGNETTFLEPNDPKWTLRKDATKEASATGDYNYTLTASIFCNNSDTEIMKFIMKKIAEVTVTMPEMRKNGSWSVEQFHYTDPIIFQFKDPALNVIYYRVVFNLYNPLRSISSLVQCTLRISNVSGTNEPVKIVNMSFVNTLDWKSTGMTVDGIGPYNDVSTGINVGYGEPVPSNISWNYGNTLLNQPFNQYGFYEENPIVGPLINVKGSMSEKMRENVRKYQDNAQSYLLPASKASFNGLLQNPDGSYAYSSSVSNGQIAAQNTVKSVMTDPQLIYEVPLSLNSNQLNNNEFTLNQIVKTKPTSRIIGIVNT